MYNHEEPTRKRSKESQRILDSKTMDDLERDARKRAEERKAARKAERDSLSNLPAWQVGLLVFGLLMVGWALLATTVMVEIAVRYINVLVAEDRQWYATNGCAEWAKAEAGNILAAVLDAQDAVCDALEFGLLKGPTDSAAMERALAPTFLGAEYVQDVDLIFSGADYIISVGHRRLDTGHLVVDFKSNSATCFLDGVNGCRDYDIPKNLKLPLWSSPINTLLKKFTVKDGAVVMWEAEPELVVTRDMMIPVYRLVFYCGPPNNAAAGRVSVMYPGGKLQDDTLGDEGRVYLVDSRGVVLVSKEPSELLISRNGYLLFRHIWELEDAPWAARFKGVFANVGEDAEPPPDINFLHESTNTEVFMSCLAPPHTRFCVVVVAPSIVPFQNLGFLSICVISMIVGLTPWALGCCGCIGGVVKHQIHLAYHPQQNPLREDEFHVKEKRLSRLSGMFNTRFTQHGPVPSKSPFSRVTAQISRVTGIFSRR